MDALSARLQELGEDVDRLLEGIAAERADGEDSDDHEAELL